MNSEIVKILETERLILREIVAGDDEFILDMLNQPSFIKYIGDRGVRTTEQARDFIENRYLKSYRDNGFGLYVVELKDSGSPIGLCGFVKRDGLPAADIGFSLLPQFEKQGFGFESASAVMRYGGEKLGFERVLAITSLDNESSGRLLEKIGLKFERLIKLPSSDEELKLFSTDA